MFNCLQIQVIFFQLNYKRLGRRDYSFLEKQEVINGFRICTSAKIIIQAFQSFSERQKVSISKYGNIDTKQRALQSDVYLRGLQLFKNME